MYEVAVLAMFKNESWIIKEWIDHYLSEGIDHFYLIDNGSTDNYLEKINPYIHDGKITLIKDSYRQRFHTQDILYNKHYLEKVRSETNWIIVVDMDEYIYSRNGCKTTSAYIATIPENINKIVLPWKLFGSSNIIAHPEDIVHSFVKRQSDDAFSAHSAKNRGGFAKSIARTSHLVKLLTHNQTIDRGDTSFSDFTPIDYSMYDVAKQYLHLNHYTHMSLQYYNEIKMKRGGGQGGVYDMARFTSLDRLLNTVTDKELSDKKRLVVQNKSVGLK